MRKKEPQSTPEASPQPSPKGREKEALKASPRLYP